jgi:hypothetical protein
LTITKAELDDLASKLNSAKSTVLERKTEKGILLEQKKSKVEQLKLIQDSEKRYLTARDLLEKSSLSARTKGQEILEEAVTKIIQIVFGDTYKVKLETKVRAGTPAVDVYVEKRIGLQNELVDLDHEGGGMTDVISLAFFTAVSRLTGGENAALIVMDEPTSAVSREHAEAVAEAISTLTEYLEKSSIVITHEREYLPNLIEHVYYVEQGVDGVSRVTEL